MRSISSSRPMHARPFRMIQNQCRQRLSQLTRPRAPTTTHKRGIATTPFRRNIPNRSVSVRTIDNTKHQLSFRSPARSIISTSPRTHPPVVASKPTTIVADTAAAAAAAAAASAVGVSVANSDLTDDSANNSTPATPVNTQQSELWQKLTELVNSNYHELSDEDRHTYLEWCSTQQLQTPVTSLHVQRKSVGPLHSSLVYTNGYRSTQEDTHIAMTPDELLQSHQEALQSAAESGQEVGPHPQGIFVWGIFDGHGSSRCSEYLEKHLPPRLHEITDLSDATQQITTMFQDLDDSFLAQSRQSNWIGGACAIVVFGQYFNTASNQLIPFADFPSDYTASRYPDIALRILCASVGDCRAAVYSKANASISQMTTDHDVSNAKERRRVLLAGGRIQLGRLNGILQPFRSFGDAELKPADATWRRPLICTPEFSQVTLHPDDILIISCDGVYDLPTMTDQHLTQVVEESRDYYSKSPLFKIENNDAVATQTETNEAPVSNDAGDKIDNWDTAGVARDVIAAALATGSTDNISVFAVHFSPNEHTAKLSPEQVHANSTTMQYDENQPATTALFPNGKEFITGPSYIVSRDGFFLRLTENDSPAHLADKVGILQQQCDAELFDRLKSKQLFSLHPEVWRYHVAMHGAPPVDPTVQANLVQAYLPALPGPDPSIPAEFCSDYITFLKEFVRQRSPINFRLNTYFDRRLVMNYFSAEADQLREVGNQQPVPPGVSQFAHRQLFHCEPYELSNGAFKTTLSPIY